MNHKILMAGAIILGSAPLSSTAMAQAAAPVCGLDNGQVAAGEPIVLGAIVGETGPDDFSASAKAANAYFDCVNANGGINGRPIEYIVGDDQWNPEIAAQLAAKIVQDEQAVAMVGNSSFVECAANAQLYADNNILAISGVGVPRECFATSNIAPTNAGPRLSTAAAAEYAIEQLGAENVVCIGPNIPNVGAWACEGVRLVAEENGKTANTILIDPGSLDATSVVLQATTFGADTVVMSLPKGVMLPVLTAAEEQGFDQTMNWLSAASGYDTTVPATLGENWTGKFYVNMEFNPLDSTEPDNRNWLAVMDAYADADDPRDTFAQAGYLAARVVTEALLTLDADNITREAVTAALFDVAAFESDIFCSTWYVGKDTARQNANNASRMSVSNGETWEVVSDCRASGDPELADIRAYEAAAGISK